MARQAPAGIPCAKCLDPTNRMVKKEHTERDHPAVRLVVKELQAGHDREENFQQLFTRYYPPLKSFFSKRGLSPEECNDLIQETFIKVFQGIGRFQHDARFDTWLYKIAGNIWKNTLRGRATQKRDAAEVNLESQLVRTTGPDPEQEALAEEQIRLELQTLRRELDRLPPRMRRCLLLRLDQGLKYREIASILGVSINTVKSLLHEAKKRLRDALGDRFPERTGEHKD